MNIDVMSEKTSELPVANRSSTRAKMLINVKFGERAPLKIVQPMPENCTENGGKVLRVCYNSGVDILLRDTKHMCKVCNLIQCDETSSHLANHFGWEIGGERPGGVGERRVVSHGRSPE